MNKHILFFSTLSLVSLMAIAAPKAHALTIEQTQTFSHESTSTCSGDCTHTFSFSSKQHQYASTDDSGRGGDHHWDDWDDDEARDGEARVTWSARGGTCHIRYGEANRGAYPYATQAACDEGGTTIGGLEPGKAYRFQVKKDNGRWSRPMRIVAR